MIALVGPRHFANSYKHEACTSVSTFGPARLRVVPVCLDGTTKHGAVKLESDAGDVVVPLTSPLNRHAAVVLSICGMVLYVVLLTPTSSWAGLQPENVFLVVNARSWSSWTIANHYAGLRDIPASNAFAPDWPGSVVEVNVDDFRDRILRPIFREIESRKLDPQIRCILYSADFPYAVSFDSDVESSPANSLWGRSRDLPSTTIW